MTFIWGTVSAVGPLRVVLDGDSVEIPVTPDSLVDPLTFAVDDRVRCELSGRRLIIHGRAGGIEIPPFVETVTVTYTTSSLANNASETATLDLGVGFTVLHFVSSNAARFRAYQSAAHRTADASRVVGVLPSGDHGLIFEDDGSAASNYAAVAVGGLLNGETLCPISITNRSGATRTITITLKVRR
ncbi:hypothetical protein GCM10022239_03320 [Leifsonia bigeumensis]|uniref:Uncharacterized protein n=1 Tax=Leifsonella bigeumensis TaxID=433643 RepID=A0ABP7F2E5_9MICO